MTARTFLDTNVLVYTDDHDNPTKQAVALALVESGYTTGHAVVSTQVLTEYFAAVTRHRRVPVDIAAAKVELFARFEVAVLDATDVHAAIELYRQEKLAWWDALIVRAAKRATCTELLTEDLQDGRRFGSLLVRNPFGGS